MFGNQLVCILSDWYIGIQYELKLRKGFDVATDGVEGDITSTPDSQNTSSTVQSIQPYFFSDTNMQWYQNMNKIEPVSHQGSASWSLYNLYYERRKAD